MNIVERKEDATQMTKERAFILGIITEEAYHSGIVSETFYRAKAGKGLPSGCLGQMGWVVQLKLGNSRDPLFIFDERCSNLLHYASKYVDDKPTHTLKERHGWYTISFDFINEGR